MHLIEFRQIARDAEVANAISPVVRRHRLTEAETEKFLLDCAFLGLRTLPESSR
jgi:hypothetical protein